MNLQDAIRSNLFNNDIIIPLIRIIEVVRHNCKYKQNVMINGFLKAPSSNEQSAAAQQSVFDNR